MVCLYQKDPRSEPSGGKGRTKDGAAKGVNLTIGFHIMKVMKSREQGGWFCLFRSLNHISLTVYYLNFIYLSLVSTCMPSTPKIFVTSSLAN